VSATVRCFDSRSSFDIANAVPCWAGIGVEGAAGDGEADGADLRSAIKRKGKKLKS
jgi:hypothetical protein